MVAELILPSQASALLLVVAALATIAGLWLGSEGVTATATRLARMFGVPDLVIGLTIVSIASSLPEIFVNLNAVNGGAAGIAAGNVVGSSFVQISLVLGLCALFAGHLKLNAREFWRDGSAVVLANLGFIAVAYDGRTSLVEGIVLVAAYAAYLAAITWTARPDGPSASDADAKPDDLAVSNRSALLPARSIGGGVMLAGGLLASAIVVWASADVLVAIGRIAGEAAGFPNGLIGLWVGVGTTFPELFISLAAITRGAAGLSLGNLLGSNVTDPLLSMGIAVVAAGGIAMTAIVTQAALVWLAGTVIALAFLRREDGLTRRPAFLLITGYLGAQYLFVAFQ